MELQFTCGDKWECERKKKLEQKSFTSNSQSSRHVSGEIPVYVRWLLSQYIKFCQGYAVSSLALNLSLKSIANWSHDSQRACEEG